MPLERLAVEFLDEPAAMDDADARGEAIDLGEDVARDEHRRAATLRELAEEFPDLDDAGRIEAVRGLVEDEQLGLVEECAG